MGKTRTATSAPGRTLRRAGAIDILGGAALIGAGAAAWIVTARELRAEDITVTPDADLLPNAPVRGPISAYAEAEIIRKHALADSQGKSFAELSRDDPARKSLLVASSLRTSLYASILSFGVSALAAGLGVLSVSTGFALRRSGKHSGRR